MFQINPYRHNCKVIKKFFSKPIVLIISILLFLSGIISVSVEIFTNNIPHIPIISFISALGFLRFYITGKSKSDNFSFNAPVNILVISSVISIVVYTLALLLSASIFVFGYFSGFNGLESNTAYYLSIGSLDFAFSSLLTSFAIYAPIFLLNILFAIAMLVLSVSFKKSSRSIYLYKRGSIFFAITSFALALAQIILIIYKGFSIECITTSFEAILSVTLGIFSIMYNRYISNVSGYIYVPQPVDKTPTSAPSSEPEQKPYESMLSTENRSEQSHNTSNSYNIPTTSFDPQPVFTQEEKPFLFCNACGKKCSKDNLFCGNCGNKLT